MLGNDFLIPLFWYMTNQCVVTYFVVITYINEVPKFQIAKSCWSEPWTYATWWNWTILKFLELDEPWRIILKTFILLSLRFIVKESSIPLPLRHLMHLSFNSQYHQHEIYSLHSFKYFSCFACFQNLKFWTSKTSIFFYHLISIFSISVN